MSNNFQPGDVVLLKSGGPKMTVVEVSEGIVCKWFMKDVLKSETFEDVALTKYDPTSVW